MNSELSASEPDVDQTALGAHAIVTEADKPVIGRTASLLFRRFSLPVVTNRRLRPG